MSPGRQAVERVRGDRHEGCRLGLLTLKNGSDEPHTVVLTEPS